MQIDKKTAVFILESLAEATVLLDMAAVYVPEGQNRHLVASGKHRCQRVLDEFRSGFLK